MNKKLAFVIYVLAILGIGILAFLVFQEKQKKELSSINSFEKCAEKYPVMESYPGRCMTPDGKSFTQDIGNELEMMDEIVLDNPRPNQEISSPIIVTGKAKGGWYFEGDFSGELFDINNNSLGVVILRATDDWMSENFVEFEGLLEFATPQTAEGELLIKNSNPSGLPENEKILRVPVKFSNINS